MMAAFIEFSRYYFALLFGAAVAVSFAGMARTGKNYLTLGYFTLILFALQLICLRTWGMNLTLKLYPLLSHIPVAVFIVLFLKRSWLSAFTCMFVSFLCCQPPR